MAPALLNSSIIESAPALPDKLSPGLSLREAIADALHRCVFGMDMNDASVFDSAFTHDTRWDLNGRISKGLKAVHENHYDRTLSQLDTSHHFTSIRIDVADDGSQATLAGVFVAYHFPKGKGNSLASPKYLSGGHLNLELVNDDEAALWKIKHYRARSIWSDGDRQGVMGHA